MTTLNEPKEGGKRSFSTQLRESFKLEAAMSLQKELEAAMDYVLQPSPAEAQEASQVGPITSPPPGQASPGPAAASPARPPPPQPAWVVNVNKWLADHPLTVKQILLRDKITYTLGLLNIILSSFLFSYPLTFISYFQFKAVLLLGGRWAYYRLKDWHYYMLEFCYVAIGVGLVQTLFFPTSCTLYQLTFALFAGVLTPAVVATRNAFVLHSVDKITSLFQHLTPALVAWLLRWWAPYSVRGWRSLNDDQQLDLGYAGFKMMTLAPMGVWLLWAVVYYLLVFVLADDKVRQRGYATMFALQTKNPNSAVSKFVFSFKHRKLQYAAYMSVHGAGCAVGCLFNNIWWHSRVAHTMLVLGVLLASMWTGAGYQMHVFSKKYMASVEAEAGMLESKTNVTKTS